MTLSNWRGVFPALMTEPHEDGSINYDGTAAHIESCLSAGVDGFVMLGTLGENNSMRADEKAEIVRHASTTVNGRVPVLSGIAEYTTELAIGSAERARDAGADGLMVLPAMVYEQDEREALTHFRSIASAIDLPIMVYNNPVSYNLDLSPENFEALADCDNIVAVKESSHDSRRITDMINQCGDRYQLFCGVDDLALENMLFGAIGWVAGTANSFPKECVALYKLAMAGRIEEAVTLYRWLMPLLHLDVNVKLVQFIKLSNQLTGEGTEWVRAPRLILEGEERAMVEAVIHKSLETRPSLDF